MIRGKSARLLNAVFLDRVRAQFAAEYREAVDGVVGRVVGRAAHVDPAVIIEEAAGEAPVADLFLGPLVPQRVVQGGDRISILIDFDDIAVAVEDADQVLGGPGLHGIGQGSSRTVFKARNLDRGHRRSIGPHEVVDERAPQGVLGVS